MRTNNNYDGKENLTNLTNLSGRENYRFVLRKYTGSGSKLRCPRCAGKSFTPYIDTKTNEILDETVGICDHKNSCGYHFSPHEYFQMFPHKKEEYFPKKDYNATNTNVKHHSNSVKHHPNTLNNQQVSVKQCAVSQANNTDTINAARPHGFAIIARAAANPRAGNAKEIQNGVGLEIVNGKQSVISSSHQYQGC